MEFEWDPNKASANVRKHRGIRFADAIYVFDDEYATTIRDDSESEEERFAIIGMDSKARLLVVVFTYRGGNIRLISARRAEPHEAEQYQEQR